MSIVREFVKAIANDPTALQELADALKALEPPREAGEVLDAHAAAAYLGLSEDALDRRARLGSIPSIQEGPRCKRFFSRDALDEWRRAA